MRDDPKFERQLDRMVSNDLEFWKELTRANDAEEDLNEEEDAA